MKITRFSHYGTGIFSFLAAGAMAFALDTPANHPVPGQNPANNPSGIHATTSITPGAKVGAARTFRASKLDGLNIRNSAGEKIGKVEDMTINVETGRVEYVALSFGGLLGFGDKLFAVPYSQLRFNHGQDETYFVLDVDKDKLKEAPGFDKSNWPDFADPNFTQKIDSYYRDNHVRETKTSQ